MKKYILISASALAAALSCQALEVERLDGMRASWLSDDGRFVVSSNSGITIRDYVNDDYYYFGTSVRIGAGNACSDTGIIVGCTDGCMTPAYLEDGDWYPLPHPMTDITYARADGITPDGKIIVGTLDCRSFTHLQYPSVQPVMWVKNEATGQYEFSMLPYPEYDFTGTTPQQVAATYISEDGNTIIGQVTDRRGFVDYNMLLRRNAEGGWDVSTPGLERVVKLDAEWPEWPEKPTLPYEGDYMTQDEIRAYNDAYQQYLEDLEIASLTGVTPKAPWPKDFISTYKEEWDAANAKYEEDASTYMTRFHEFDNAYRSNLLNTKYNFKTEILSRNGKYAASAFTYVDPNADPNDPTAKAWCSPVLFDLNGDEVAHNLLVDESMYVFSVLNDGTMVTVSPADDSHICSRMSFIVSPDLATITPFEDWIMENVPEAYAWMDENMRYDVTADQAADGVAATNAFLCGSVRFSSDMSKMITYMYEPDTSYYTSWFFDFGEPAGVENTKVAESSDAFGATARDGVLYIYGAPASIKLFDLSGREVLAAANPESSLSLGGIPSGVYLVTLSSANAARTVKIAIK